jgi:hypothetical protein
MFEFSLSWLSLLAAGHHGEPQMTHGLQAGGCSFRSGPRQWRAGCRILARLCRFATFRYCCGGVGRAHRRTRDRLMRMRVGSTSDKRPTAEGLRHPDRVAPPGRSLGCSRLEAVIIFLAGAFLIRRTARVQPFNKMEELLSGLSGSASCPCSSGVERCNSAQRDVISQCLGEYACRRSGVRTSGGPYQVGGRLKQHVCCSFQEAFPQHAVDALVDVNELRHVEVGGE